MLAAHPIWLNLHLHFASTSSSHHLLLRLLLTKDNGASLRLWDKLGFQRVGLIPKAGRLRTGPGGTEELVDAVVVYKSFV